MMWLGVWFLACRACVNDSFGSRLGVGWHVGCQRGGCCIFACSCVVCCVVTGLVWHGYGVAWCGVVCCAVAGPGVTWHAMLWCDVACRDVDWHVMQYRGLVCIREPDPDVFCSPTANNV